MLSLNQNVFPKTGYQFKDSDGTLIVGDTWGGVIARTKAYRKRAGLPEGDAASEVTAQACANNPGICRNEDGAYRQKLAEATLKTRVLQYLNGMRGLQAKGPIPWVSEAERAERANICAKCPLNTALPEGCSSCKKAVNELRKAVVGKRFIDGRLNGCVAMGEDIAVSTHIDHLRVSNGELPAHCWRKAT